MTTDTALIDAPAVNHARTAFAPESGANLDHENSHSLAPAALSLLGAALLAACGGGGGSESGTADAPIIKEVVLPSASGFNNFPSAKTDAEAARFVLQSQLGATDAEIAAVKSGTFAYYLQKQFAKPVAQTGWDWLEGRGYGADAAVDKNVYNSAIADFVVWSQLMSAPDAMRKRVSLALSEFFVVSMNSMEVDWRGYTIAAYWDLLNKYAFDNFRNLLEAVTLSPAMGHFLNTRGNQKEDGKGRLPDENYAREVMQLFTIGVYALELDGTVKTSGGKKVESYTSDDVSNLARVFTGYDFDPAYRNSVQFPGKDYKVYNREYARQPMKLDETRHSTLDVKFLNVSIAGSVKGTPALKAALDGLFNHPNVGPFFGRQMIQRLVTSNPSPAYVARVASAFNNNGAGVRGDMKAVWTAILLDDEARGTSGLSNVAFGKLREPMLRFTQWARSFNAVSKTGSWKIFDLSDSSYSLGQSPFHSPSVFNYFRPGYVPPGTAMANTGATAPEFQMVNETTVGGYVNYMQNMIRNGMKTPRPSSAEVVYTDYTLDIEGDYSNLLALINNSTSNDAESQRVALAITARLNLLLCAGQLSTSTANEISNALKAAMLQSNKKITSASTDAVKRDLVAAAILMVMSCPDYLIQK
jgi:uncharacterized protein (DUF1800 family)